MKNKDDEMNLEKLLEQIFKPMEYSKDKEFFDKMFDSKTKAVKQQTINDRRNTIDLIERRFKNNLVNATQIENKNKIKKIAKDVAYSLFELAPDNRERNLALTKLEEFMGWAIISIERGGNKNV